MLVLQQGEDVLFLGCFFQGRILNQCGNMRIGDDLQCPWILHESLDGLLRTCYHGNLHDIIVECGRERVSLLESLASNADFQ